METIANKEYEKIISNEKIKVVNRIDKDDDCIILFCKAGNNEVTLKFYCDYLLYIYKFMHRKVKYHEIITLCGNSYILQACDTTGKMINHTFKVDDEIFDILMSILSQNPNINVEKFKTKRKEEIERQMKFDNLFKNKIFVSIIIILIFLILFVVSPNFALAIVLVGIIIYIGIKIDKRKQIAKKQKQEEEIYDMVISDVNKTPKERYTIDKEKLLKIFDIWKDAGISASVKGMQMQRETGPQHDWAIASGIANGIAGGAASLATAMDIMEKNRKATEAHHKLGKTYEIGGRNAAREAMEQKEKFEKINFDEFEFSDIDENLIDELNIKYDNLQDFGTKYVEIDVTVSAKKDEYIFPNTKEKAKIDGSFRINLYNKKNKQFLASGYYIANNRAGNDKSKAGYNTTEQKKTVLLMKKENIKINSNNIDNYIITTTNPNLWLLKL